MIVPVVSLVTQALWFPSTATAVGVSIEGATRPQPLIAPSLHAPGGEPEPATAVPPPVR